MGHEKLSQEEIDILIEQILKTFDGEHYNYTRDSEKPDAEEAANIRETLRILQKQINELLEMQKSDKESMRNDEVAAELIDEDYLSAALEIFVNPARIKILKVLIAGGRLFATEISELTGISENKIARHLRDLENASLIRKSGNEYILMENTENVLTSIWEAVSKISP